MDLHNEHKRHRHILYLSVVFLFIFQIISFVMISAQFSKLNAKLNTEIKRVETNLTSYFIELMENYNSENQRNFRDVSLALAQQAAQQQSFEKEIVLIKSSQQDFSSIVDDSIKSVVAVLTERSMGSGFIINPKGYVVTNYHVVQKEEEIKILTQDKRLIAAEIVGFDRLRDLALLKIEGEYDSLEMARNENVQVGRKVIAIGNPLGLSFTVTEGIISAINREGPNGLEEYVQTDVSLNPGNSGGPLIDTEGKVVGMNNFKVGGAESLGFALESEAIKKSVNSIVGQNIIK